MSRDVGMGDDSPEVLLELRERHMLVVDGAWKGGVIGSEEDDLWWVKPGKADRLILWVLSELDDRGWVCLDDGLGMAGGF